MTVTFAQLSVETADAIAVAQIATPEFAAFPNTNPVEFTVAAAVSELIHERVYSRFARFEVTESFIRIISPTAIVTLSGVTTVEINAGRSHPGSESHPVGEDRAHAAASNVASASMIRLFDAFMRLLLASLAKYTSFCCERRTFAADARGFPLVVVAATPMIARV